MCVLQVQAIGQVVKMTVYDGSLNVTLSEVFIIICTHINVRHMVTLGRGDNVTRGDKCVHDLTE